MAPNAGTSILLRLESATQLANQLPWMCGTFGTVSLDIFLLYQGLTMGKHAIAASKKLLSSSPTASSGVVTALDGSEIGSGEVVVDVMTGRAGAAGGREAGAAGGTAETLQPLLHEA